MKLLSAVVLGGSAVITAGSFVLMRYQPGAAASGVSSNRINLALEPRHPVTLKMESDSKAVAGEAAPDIELQGSDKTQVKLADLLQKGPVVVVMTKDGCPCSEEAQPFFNDLSNAYKGKITFLGVMDANPRIVSKFKDDFSVPYPMACEPGMATFTKYQALHSVYFTVIGKDGKVVKQFPGYSKTTLATFNSMLATAAGVQPPKLDFSMAPDRETSGCPFGESLPKP